MVEVSVRLADMDVSLAMEPLFNQAVAEAINTTLLVIKDKWQQEAQNKLNSTRMDYLMGLNFDSIEYPFENDPFKGAVTLLGKWPNMLEQGFPAFDMKTGFAGSSKRIATKGGGWLLRIPMRHSTPGAFLHGRPMPPDIYAAARRLPHWGSLRVSGGEQTSWTGYQHRSNIYDRLTRVQHNYGSRTQSTYMTWRTVSNNSDPKSWWHPGFVGVHIAESLESFAKTTFQRVLNINMNQVFQNDMVG